MNGITKKLKAEYIKSKLSTDKVWALRALVVVYNNQTNDEKACERTAHHNNIGFTGTDGEFFTSLAKQYEARGNLSYKQLGYVMKRMKKYWKQVLAVSDEKKLIQCMYRDGIITKDDVDNYELNLFVGKI